MSLDSVIDNRVPLPTRGMRQCARRKVCLPVFALNMDMM